jgi:flagellar FliJ protein
MPSKTFKFRLQTVLEYKERQEREEQRELAKRQEILAKEEQKLKFLMNLKQMRQREMASKSSEGKLNVLELKMYQDHQKRLTSEISDQQIRVQQAQSDVELQREKLLKAVQERKTYEQLKEKHYQAYLAEIEAEERKLLDDIATAKFSREEEKFL